MERTITQRELAALLNVTPSNLSEFFSGKRRFSASRSARLEQVTGIDLRTWLFGRPEEIRRELERAYGKINFRRGRVPASRRMKQ